MSRSRLLAQMQREARLSESNISRIQSAARAFSARQLGRMARVGVRFWSDDDLPRPFSDRSITVPPMSTRAAYVPSARVIRLRPAAHTDDIRHELAHAWDHVRTGRVNGYPDRMSTRQIMRMIGRPVTMWSESSTRRLVAVGRRRFRLTMSQMLDRYRRRARLRENSFDNPRTREGYSKRNVREFYAEGYAVFHGSSGASKSRMLHRAPELYSLMEREARSHGLAVPDRSALESSGVF